MTDRPKEIELDAETAKRISKENEKLSDDLAYSLYQSMLDAFDKDMKRDSKETFGFNMFAEGIRLGLELTTPVLDEDGRKKVKNKIISIMTDVKKAEKEAKDSKMLTVTCSFCGKEMKCPEKMKDAKKHICFECFENAGPELNKISKDEIENIHIDIPTDKAKEAIPGMIVGNLVNETFPKLWSEHKHEIKEMSKRELAEKMFGMGAFTVMDMIKSFEEWNGGKEEKSKPDK